MVVDGLNLLGVINRPDLSGIMNQPITGIHNFIGWMRAFLMAQISTLWETFTKKL